jgi:hypothetical protein
MFAASRDEVIPREKATIRAQKVMLTIFFNDVSLITLTALSSGARFNQEYFIHSMLPEIIEVRGRFSIDFAGENFAHIDNCIVAR